jgi:hypothetical protein
MLPGPTLPASLLDCWPCCGRVSPRRLPFCSREIGLPVLARLHLPGKGAGPGKVETAAALVSQLALAFPARLVHVVAHTAAPPSPGTGPRPSPPSRTCSSSCAGR